MDNIFCSAVAFVHFYFSLAGILWWLMLCFSWFLVTTLKWGEAPVGEYSICVLKISSIIFRSSIWLLL
jgi:hypothetical protein